MALLLLDAARWSKCKGRDKCLSPCVKRGGLRFPASSPQGWGGYVAMAVGLIIASDGKSRRREERGEGRKSIHGSFL